MECSLQQFGKCFSWNYFLVLFFLELPASAVVFLLTFLAFTSAAFFGFTGVFFPASFTFFATCNKKDPNFEIMTKNKLPT